MWLRTAAKKPHKEVVAQRIWQRFFSRDLGLVDLFHWYQLRHSNRTFVLGLGNQRCGTTWLYNYLNLSGAFNGGRLKEYHIWDGLDVDLQSAHRTSTSEKNLDKDYQLRYKMQQAAGFYFEYFASFYSEDISLSADITPSYSSLEKPRLKFIKHEFAKMGIGVKVLISIRNPIDRIKSAVRLNLNRQDYREGITLGTKNFEDALRQYYVSEHCEIRTNYHETIEKARSIFGAQNVYVAIFETMFSTSEIERFLKF